MLQQVKKRQQNLEYEFKQFKQRSRSTGEDGIQKIIACSADVFRERIRMHFDRAPSWILTRERIGDRKKVS